MLNILISLATQPEPVTSVHTLYGSDKQLKSSHWLSTRIYAVIVYSNKMAAHSIFKEGNMLLSCNVKWSKWVVGDSVFQSQMAGRHSHICLVWFNFRLWQESCSSGKPPISGVFCSGSVELHGAALWAQVTLEDFSAVSVTLMLFHKEADMLGFGVTGLCRYLH